MKWIKYHFYDAVAAKADGKPMTMVDRIIMLRSNFVHVERQYSYNRGHVSCSSTMADCANGSRFKYITYSHPEWWKTIAVPYDDAEEQKMWECDCNLCDKYSDWQQTEIKLSELSGNIQGFHHIEYDKYGLMSFALEHSDKWYENILRGVIWGWTAIIQPDPIKVWCSEHCSIGHNASGHQCKILPTEIDPQALYEQIIQMPGAKEIK